MLTAVERRAFDCAPMHAYTAPEAGTGKSYLADLVLLHGDGSNCSCHIDAAMRKNLKEAGRIVVQGRAGYCHR